MDKSEKIYRLAGELTSLIYTLGLNGWANELELENKKTGELVQVKIKVDIIKSKKSLIK